MDLSPFKPKNGQAAPKAQDWLAEWEKADWLSQHGQLGVDVFQNEKEIILKSAVAGVKPADLDISINNDVLTLRGRRHREEKVDKNAYLFQECYWGDFSRTIVLPCAVENDKVKANLKNGILTVVIPKSSIKEKGIKIEEIEEF